MGKYQGYVQVITFSSVLYFQNINYLLTKKKLKKTFIIFVLLSLLLISCSSAKRFTKDEIEKNDLSSVRVLIDETELVYHLSVQAPVYLFSNDKKIALIKPGNTIECSARGEKIQVNIDGNNFYSEAFLLHPSENENAVKFNGVDYKGELKLVKLGKSIGIINHLNLEDYVKGVVAKEMPSGLNSENMEALKAFAICVRTYTLKKISEHKTNFDLYDDTRDQVYGGYSAENSSSNTAVNETRNLVLNFEYDLATIFYHSTCGGRTESSFNVFTNNKLPYLEGIVDGVPPNCRISPRFEWEEIFNGENLIKRLKKSSLIDSEEYKFENLYINSRFPSGRINELVFELTDQQGIKKEISVFGNNIRSIIGSTDAKNILWSTLFDISLRDNEVKISGRGFGHGVGLCQWGAISLSRNGWTCDEILNHYFPGTKIASLND